MWLQARELKWGLRVNKWIDVKCSDVEWTDVNYVKWSEASYGEVLGDNSTMYIRVTLYWGYLIVLWLFHLVCILYCVCFNLLCNECVCVCVCVYVYVCMYVCLWGVWQLFGCFGNMCTCNYCVLFCLCCVLVLFLMHIHSYLFCL